MYLNTDFVIIRIVVDCGPLDNPPNGLVNTESRTTYNSGAVYSCNEGHQLTGRGRLTCMDNGQWSSSTSTCDRNATVGEFLDHFADVAFVEGLFCLFTCHLHRTWEPGLRIIVGLSLGVHGS